MANNIFGATFQALGGDMTGLLDLRARVEAQRGLNPYVQEAQQLQAQRDADQARAQMGIMPGSLDAGFQDASGMGLSVDTGTEGLLADPIFAQRRPELQAAIGLMENPGTSALGQGIISNVLNSAQQDRRLVADNELELEKYALDQIAAQDADERARRQQLFQNEQALESDYAAALAPVKGAVDQYGLLEQSIASQSPIGLTASIFQLAKLFDPGSRTVTEGDVTTIEGAFPFQQQLSTALSKLQGGGWDQTAADQILKLAGQLTTQQIEQNRPVFENFLGRAQRGEMDPRNVIGRFGLDRIYAGGAEAMQRFNPGAVQDAAQQAAQGQADDGWTYSDTPPNPRAGRARRQRER